MGPQRIEIGVEAHRGIDRSNDDVKTHLSTVSSPRTRRGRRYGYSSHWWGDAGRARGGEASYWNQTRRPIAALCLVLPCLLVYEVGVWALGGSSEVAVRTGIDAWIRHGLSHFGLTDRWLPPLALVLALVLWQAAERRSMRFDWRILPGMLLESVAWAAMLIALSQLVDLGLNHVNAGAIVLQTSTPQAALAARFIGFLGAGIYEEAIFRLALLPLILLALRGLLVPQLPAGVLAVIGSSLLFSLAHHLGSADESFSWYAFVFRWLAGVCFAWVFVARGFGIAVGTHVAYDWFVGLIEAAPG